MSISAWLGVSHVIGSIPIDYCVCGTCHLRQMTQVAGALPQVPISRRLLEKRLLASVECTPYNCFCRLRVETAKRLLASPERRKICAIARDCGFPSADRMRLTFLRLTGQTLTEVRSRNQQTPKK